MCNLAPSNKHCTAADKYPSRDAKTIVLRTASAQKPRVVIWTRQPHDGVASPNPTCVNEMKDVLLVMLLPAGPSEFMAFL